MTSVEIKEYLFMVLDVEKNVYIQEQTLSNLISKHNSLGHKQRFSAPMRKIADVDYGGSMLTVGIIGVIIGIIIGFFIKIGEFWEDSGIFGVILAALYGLFIALFTGIGGGLIIGPIVAKISASKDQKELDDEYNYYMDEYTRSVEKDNARVEDELAIKASITRDIDVLRKRLDESKNVLNNLYSYNIIAQNPEYRGLIPIASFYQYFEDKRTFSLEFDRETGDQGAYNLYQDDLRYRGLIDKLDVVLQKLDDILQVQRQLVSTMREANSRITQLTNSVGKKLSSINKSIQSQTAIQEYHAERTNEELRFMNTMNIIYKWH